MSRKQSRPRWDVLFNWVLMSALGLMIGMFARQMLFGIVFGLTSGLPAKALEGAILGLTLGLIQMFSLPHPLRRSFWWAGGSALGWAVGWSLGWSLGWTLLGGLGFSGVFMMSGLIAGAVAGLVQWFFILRSDLPRAGWWIPASTVGWGVGLALAMNMRGALGWPVAGGLGGLLTGLLLFWLVRNSPPYPHLNDTDEAPAA